MSNQSTKDQIYSSLGKLVVSFQELESAIERLIFASMTSSYPQARIMMSEMSFKAKVNVMNSLVKDIHQPQEEIFGAGNIYVLLDGIVANCRQCEEKRNQLIHSLWIPEFKNAPELVVRIKENAKSKRGYGYSVESMNHVVIENSLSLIDSTAREIRDFCQKLSLQFNRIHGLPGMEKFADHSKLVDAIHKSVLENEAKNANNP